MSRLNAGQTWLLIAGGFVVLLAAWGAVDIAIDRLIRNRNHRRST